MKLTIVLVTEVPMFDPMIIGTAVLTGTSVATRPTMMVVEVEEDWTRTVTSTPIMTPTTGLFRRVESAKNAKIKKVTIFFSMICILRPPIFFPPRSLKESERKEREQMKK